MPVDVQARARVHAALGEPVRLAVVDELAGSDRSPAELAAQFDVASNLLAHHLDVLEEVGLIERFVSAGDRRRRYVRLVRPVLADLGIATPLPPDRSMVFVCTHNSARSQLAAALWTERTGHAASSAGTQPALQVHPGAVAAGRRIGLDLEGATPRRFDPDEHEAFVVTVCDRAHEELGSRRRSWHWSIPDPVASDSAAAFDTAVARLDERINALVPPNPTDVPTNSTDMTEIPM